MCLVSLVSDVSFLISRPADRREAVLVPSLQQGVRRQVQSQGSPTDPFGCEKIPMQELLQNLLQDVSSAQAWGIWLLCSTLNWDTFPPAKKKRTLCYIFFFFLNRQTKRTVRELRGAGSFPRLCCVFFSFFFISNERPISFQREKQHSAHSVSVIAARRRAFHAMLLTYLCYSCTFSACLDSLIFFPKSSLSCLVPMSLNGCYTVLRFFFSFLFLFCFVFVFVLHMNSKEERHERQYKGILKPSLRREQVQI